MRMIIQDSHTHGIGYLNHLNSVLRKGFISTNIKKLIKKHQSSCVTCHHLRLLSSTSKQSPQTALIYSKSPPFSTSQIDFAGPFQRKEGVKAYKLVVTCSWSDGVLFQALPSLTASDTLRALEIAMAAVGRTTPAMPRLCF